MYGEIVQIKQDRMIPVFRCTVIETLTAQHCGVFPHVGVTRYLKFRELKPMEACECRKARTSGSILISGHPVDGKVGATVSHTKFLAGDLDDEDNCEVGTVTTSDNKTLKGMAAQGLYKITLREEFARMNELTGSLMLTSGVQARATDKSAGGPNHCNDVPPPRYKVGGKWYCSYPQLKECHDPAMLPSTR